MDTKPLCRLVLADWPLTQKVAAPSPGQSALLTPSGVAPLKGSSIAPTSGIGRQSAADLAPKPMAKLSPSFNMKPSTGPIQTGASSGELSLAGKG